MQLFKILFVTIYLFFGFVFTKFLLFLPLLVPDLHSDYLSGSGSMRQSNADPDLKYWSKDYQKALKYCCCSDKHIRILHIAWLC
jgi:hypothetical protein